MLNQVLQEIAKSKESIPLTTLGHKLGIEQGALEGMLMYWVRKGRLKLEDDLVERNEAVTCAGKGGCSACSGAATCPFIARVPKTYTLPVKAIPKDRAQ